MRGKVCIALVALVVGLLVGSWPASAGFPGQNGKIAFTSDRDGNNGILLDEPERVGPGEPLSQSGEGLGASLVTRWVEDRVHE